MAAAAGAGAPAMAVDEDTMQDCLSTLANPDSLMEVNAFRTLARYVKAGGRPETVIQLLADNYRGYAQMCNLVAEWLDIAGVGEEESTALMETHIKETIHRTFDEERAQAIFDDDSEAPWLSELIQHQTWRRLLYRLSEEHKASLMLNFAIKRICKAGFQEEIAGVSTVANQLDVYSSVLSHAICSLARLSESELQKQIGRFSEMVIQTQHTYVYAQCLLHAAMRPGVAPDSQHVLKRLSQEIQLAATKSGQAVIPHDLLLFSGAMAYQQVAAALGEMLSHGALNTADMMVLFEAYSGESPPPVEMLRLPKLFELFEREFFTPGRSPPAAYASNYLFVLAYAVSVSEDEFGGNDTSDLLATSETLARVASVLQQAAVHEDAIASVTKHLQLPVVSKGLLFWIRGTTADPAFFSHFTANLVPPHLRLLDEIALQHQRLWHATFDVLCEIYTRSYAVDALVAIDIKRMLLDRLVLLLAIGHTLPVLDFVVDHLAQTDVSLIIHFLHETIKYTGEPFSGLFVVSIMRLAGRADVLLGFRKRPGCHALVSSFFRAAAKTAGLVDATARSLRHILTSEAWIT